MRLAHFHECNIFQFTLNKHTKHIFRKHFPISVLLKKIYQNEKVHKRMHIKYNIKYIGVRESVAQQQRTWNGLSCPKYIVGLNYTCTWYGFNLFTHKRN